MDTLLNEHYKFDRLDYSQDFNLSATQPSQTVSKWAIVILLVFTQIPALSIASEKTATNQYSDNAYFVEFQAGNYQQNIPNSLEPLLESLKQRPQNQTITLTGYSESRTSFASQQLALNRAEIIKKLLVKKGISANRIKTNSYFENFKAEGELLHGVFATTAQKYDADEVKDLNANKHNQTQKNLALIGFIEFEPSNYDQGNQDDTDIILPKIKLLPTTATIKIIGISQSKTFLATDKLALQRAQVIADSLVAEGIEPERIQLDTQVSNLVEHNYLIHGVYIYADIKNEVATETANTNQFGVNNPNHNNKISTQKVLNDVIQQLNKNTISSTPQATKPSNSNHQLCAELKIEKGSLKNNIQREIADCGYLMGEWNFGTDEEYIDWLIPVAYKVNVDEGIFGILNIIETNYQIRAHLHQLDKSIDFLPSIKRTKVQGQ